MFPDLWEVVHELHPWMSSTFSCPVFAACDDGCWGQQHVVHLALTSSVRAETWPEAWPPGLGSHF